MATSVIVVTEQKTQSNSYLDRTLQSKPTENDRKPISFEFASNFLFLSIFLE